MQIFKKQKKHAYFFHLKIWDILFAADCINISIRVPTNCSHSRSEIPPPVLGYPLHKIGGKDNFEDPDGTLIDKTLSNDRTINIFTFSSAVLCIAVVFHFTHCVRDEVKSGSLNWCLGGDLSSSMVASGSMSKWEAVELTHKERIVR